MYFFTSWDPCCYRVLLGDPFATYLVAGGRRTNRSIEVYVDDNNGKHGLSESGYAELEQFLAAII